MYLLSKSEYSRAVDAVRHTTLDKVYPLSIAEGTQSGAIFANRADDPRSFLFWHACGFGFPAGTPDNGFLHEIAALMQSPLCAEHHGRLALESETDSEWTAFFQSLPSVQKQEQYQFSFVGTDTYCPADPAIVPIDASNYHLLVGRIVPSFSWDSEAQFLAHGFGFCVFHEGEFAACAFSAAVSREYVDIGVETAEAFRGKGFGKRVVNCMTDEILRRRKIPLWQCSTQNEASARLARSTGFILKNTHPLFVSVNP